MPQYRVFVTGGAGYVGSHCVLELLKSDYDVIAVDNLVNAIAGQDENSLPESLRRVELLAGKKIEKFYKVDLNDEEQVMEIFKEHKFDAVIHFAALKAVGESCQIPLAYYRNNICGTINLLEIMKKFGVKRFIFSSSATVYGIPKYLPIDEKHVTGLDVTNPYGRTKYFIEEILKDLSASEKGWCVTSLRYFNPVGAHESGEIGEDPQGIPNNLMPFVAQVAVKRRPYLNVFGNDFNTIDGTGVRDYIHIMDLAKGHVVTLDKMLKDNWTGWNVFNLGTGRGYSVLEVISAFKAATGVTIPHQITDRRAGDIDSSWGDVQMANQKLGWKAELTMKEMCEHTWRWQSKYPMGYRSGHLEPVIDGITSSVEKNGKTNGSNGSNGSNGNTDGNNNGKSELDVTKLKTLSAI
ncbi:unnamed protein product [Sphagnum balticum]